MKKNIKIFLTIIVMIVLIMLTVLQKDSKAASFNASISKTSATVGESITITMNANNAAGMYKVSISGSAVTLSSGSSSEWIENQSLKLTLKASKVGTSKITVTSNDMTDLDNSENKLNVTKTFTVTVKEKTTSGGGTTAGGNSNSGSSTSGGNSSGNNSSGGNSSGSTTTKAPKFKSANKTVYTTGTINLRSSWSTNSSATTVPEGTALTLTGTSAETINGYVWYRVKYNGATKYVASNLVTSTKPTKKKETEKSDNNDLSSLIIEDVTLEPDFSKDVTEYNVQLKDDVTELTIDAKTESGKAKIEITGNKDLQDGENTITITVTAEDGSTKKYTIKAIKGEGKEEGESTSLVDNSALKLSNLEISGVDFAGIFNPDTHSYELNLNISVKNLNITATPNQEGATVEIIGNENFVEGENMVTILVTSADGNQTATYQIKVVMPSQAIENKDNIQFYFICGGIVLAAVIVIIIVVVIYKKRKNNEAYDEKDLENIYSSPLEDATEKKEEIKNKEKTKQDKKLKNKPTVDEFLDTSKLEEKTKRSKGRHSK